MRLFVLLCSAFFLIACKSDLKNKSHYEVKNTQALNVPDGFDYKMDRNIRFQLQVFDHNGIEAQQVGIKIYYPVQSRQTSPSDSLPSIADIPSLIFSGQTDSHGYLEETLVIPVHLKSIQVQTSQLGIINKVSLPLNSHVIYHAFK